MCGMHALHSHGYMHTTLQIFYSDYIIQHSIRAQYMQFVTRLYNNTAYYYTVLVGDTRVSKLVPIEHESKPTALYDFLSSF